MTTKKTRATTGVTGKGGVGDVSVEAVQEIDQEARVEAVGPELEVVWVDPAAVQLDENVRTSPRLTEEFVETIRTQGVLAPVIAHRDLLGQVVVTDGQRRVLAARQAGLARIPAILAGDPGSPEARVVDQLTLNEARAPLTTSERAAAVQQLSLFGMEPETVARRIGVRRDQVADLLKVAGAPATREVAAEVPELTISQAALLADIEASPVSTDLDVLAEVTERIAVDPAQADQVLELARRQVAYEEAFRAVEADLDEIGFAHLRKSELEAMVWDERSKYAQVNEEGRYFALYTPRGEWISPEAHESCPGHVIVLAENEHSGDIYIEQIPYCSDRKAYGHRQKGELKAPKKTSAEETPEERAERERKSVERQHAIDMNRLSDSAKVVRDRYVLDLLAQRKAPKDAIDFVARIFTAGEFSACHLDVNPEELLRAAHALPQGVSMSAWVRSTQGAAERVLLASTIAQREERMGRDFWKQGERNASGEVWYGSTTCLYLRQLAAWGYALSDIERDYCEAIEAAQDAAAADREEATRS